MTWEFQVKDTHFKLNGEELDSYRFVHQRIYHLTTKLSSEDLPEVALRANKLADIDDHLYKEFSEHQTMVKAGF